MNNSPRLLRLALRTAAIAVIAAPAVFAQFDSSGNALLTGSYRFRYVATLATNANGTVVESTASQGVLTFDGKGNYAISTGSQWNDNTVSSGAFQTIPQGSTGTYAISSAGLGYISNPNPNPNLVGNPMYGTFSQGVFTASTTEESQDSYGNTYPATNDLLVAVAVGPVPTNSSFTSPYWIGALDFAQGTDSDVKNALFQITPNGNGGLGSLSIQGQANSNTASCSAATCLLHQTSSGATYSFGSDGNAQFNIPAPSGVSTPQVLVSGKRNVYVSADGSFLLGWTTNGYDILFGVKALPSDVAGADNLYTGLYYLAGIGDQPSIAGTQNFGPFSFWGSENADGAENEWVHQRVYFPTFAPFTDSNGYALSSDYTSWNETALNPDGTAGDLPLSFLYFGGSSYVFGDAGGNCVPSVPNAACAFVAISNTSGTMGLTIGIHAPDFTGSGVFLNPLGVVNAASFAPITASIQPGEFLTLFGSFGSNIPSSGITSPAPFPTLLGPIQVAINGQPAPIYYVNQNQINVIAPFGLANNQYNEVQIQVTNTGLGQASNTVSAFTLDNDAQPGIFSYGPNGNGASDGIGFAIAEHADGSLITASNPAHPNETIVLGMGGLGTVTPTVADGAIPSSTTLSYVDDFSFNALLVFFNDFDNNQFFAPAVPSSGTPCTNSGCPVFAGLYPGFPGEYQVNVTVPAGVGPSNTVYLNVITPYANTYQVSIPVAAPTSGSAVTAARTAKRSPTSSGGAMIPPAPQLSRRPPQQLGSIPALPRTSVMKVQPAAPVSPQQ